MLTKSERQTLREKLAEYEGNIPHMYLDSKGNVTVGVGHLLSTVTEAQKLPFIDDKSKKKATPAEIKTDFEAVSKLPKRHNNHATFYKAHTKLVLTQPEIDALTESHIENFHSELRQKYIHFSFYPKEARLALFDMLFNLGMKNLRELYIRFNMAIYAKDWQKAADESNRTSANASRNRYVKDLFEKAAEDASKNKRP